MALTTIPASLSATALTLTTAAQPNITSVGTLTGLTVSGNIAGTLTTAAQTNITSVGTLTSLTTSGLLTVGSGAGALKINESFITARSSDNVNDINLIANINVYDADDVVIGSTSGQRFNDNIVFRTNGVQALRLDVSRNATFAGAISSGAITSSGVVKTTSSDGFVINNIGRMKMNSNNLYLETETNGTGIVLNSRTGFVTFQNNGSTAFQINSSNNSTFQGTISSGAITSSGNIVNTGTIQATHSATISAQTNMQLALRDADSVNMRANFMVEDNTNTNRGGLAIQATEAGVSNDRDIYLQPHGGRVGVLTSSPQYGLDVNTTSRFVHDATFGGAISSGAISSSGDIDTTGLLRVGVNDTEYANNYLRFKSAGDAYFDHHTTGQKLRFRLSNSSALDTTPLILNSDGHVTIPDGNLVVASGHGIDFSANANTTTTGATTTAEILDDYEEGNWTPVVEGHTGGNCTMSSTNMGRYVKVGAKVTVNGTIGIASVPTLSGSIVLTGLPFPSKNNSNYRSNAAPVTNTAITPGTGMTMLGIGVDANYTFAWIVGMNPVNKTYTHTPTVGTGNLFGFSMTYITDS